MKARTGWPLGLLLAACGGDEGADPKTHRVTIYGEEYVEDAIPADDTDGWRIEFDEFLVVVAEVEAGGAKLGGARVADLTHPSNGVGHAVGDLADGPHPRLDYRIAPSPDARAGNATPDQVEAMRQGGHSLRVAGTATKGSERKTFAWAFATDARYVGCHTDPADVDEGTVRSALTIHADHLFYDDLVSAEPNVAFQLVADADADGDGHVTEAELRAVDITGLERYQVGNRGDVTTLWAFIEAQTTTLGHIDGEGHCHHE